MCLGLKWYFIILISILCATLWTHLTFDPSEVKIDCISVIIPLKYVKMIPCLFQHMRILNQRGRAGSFTGHVLPGKELRVLEAEKASRLR